MSEAAQRVLVTGASGFAGSLLIPQLASTGARVRAFGRSKQRVRSALGQQSAAVEICRGDALSGAGLANALRDTDVAYYLIHSMERPAAGAEQARAAGRDSFGERERRAAERFAAAAQKAGLRRIVYLGGLLPKQATMSPHIASRLAVERILLEAVPDSIAFRSSIVIGARSRSFRLLVRLIERMPVLALPRWRALRTQPIDQRDLIAVLAAASDLSLPGSRSIELGGPEAMSYEEIIAGIADAMLLKRPLVHLPIGESAIGSRLAAAIAGEQPELVVPLMASLVHDLLPAGDPEGVAAEFGVVLHSFTAAVEHALAEWERSEQLAAR